MEDNGKKNIRVPEFLPPGWELKSIENISTVIMGQSPPSSTYNEARKGLPFFQGKAEFGALYPEPAKWCSAPNKVAQKDDVLMSVRAPVGPTNLAPFECCIGRGLSAIRPAEDIPSKYILYYLRSIESQVDSLGTGTTFKAISGDTIRKLLIPIAPRDERPLIVAEIEKQFSRLDEAVAGLKRVKANLKRYKAAVLKAAVEGRLVETEAELARRQGRSYETGEQLLKRILETRRSQWKSKGKYKEPASPDTAGLPELPKGWVWATLDQIGQEGRPVIYGIIKPGPHVSNGVPYVRVTEMKDGIIDVANLKRAASERAAKFARATLAAGDVLISKDGTIGRVAVVPPQLAGGNITQHVMRAPVHELMCRDYVVWSIRSDICQRWLTGETKGVALRGVNVEDFRRLPIPVAPLQEQGRIVTEVERRLSIINEVAAEVDTNLIRCERMRQATLSQAFAGSIAHTRG